MPRNYKYRILMELSEGDIPISENTITLNLRTKEQMYSLYSYIIGGLCSEYDVVIQKYIRHRDNWVAIPQRSEAGSQAETHLSFKDREVSYKLYRKCKLSIKIKQKDGTIVPLVFYYNSTEDADITLFYLKIGLSGGLVDYKVERRQKDSTVWDAWIPNVLCREDFADKLKQLGPEESNELLTKACSRDIPIH